MTELGLGRSLRDPASYVTRKHRPHAEAAWRISALLRLKSPVPSGIRPLARRAGRGRRPRVRAARLSIRPSHGSLPRELLSWWARECRPAVRFRAAAPRRAGSLPRPPRRRCHPGPRVRRPAAGIPGVQRFRGASRSAGPSARYRRVPCGQLSIAAIAGGNRGDPVLHRHPRSGRRSPPISASRRLASATVSEGRRSRPDSCSIRSIDAMLLASQYLGDV